MLSKIFQIIKNILIFQKQWQEAIMSDDRLSLTLEEIVHIRSVLTKAELEVLPVEGRVKEDVEKRRVSFFTTTVSMVFRSRVKSFSRHWEYPYIKKLNIL